MTHQSNETPFIPDLIINLPRTEQGEAARSMALAMSDEELKKWANDISLRDFGEPYDPVACPWLKDERDGWIDFVVGSYLP